VARCRFHGRPRLYWRDAIDPLPVNDTAQPTTAPHDPQRREHPRADVRLAGTAHFADDRALPVWIQNVSRDGMLIVFAAGVAGEVASTGKPVVVEVALTDEQPRIRVRAQVRWTFAFGVGVKIVEADPALMERLRAAVNERLKAVASSGTT
jgi:c-di-GMP-binding flagellar brake protein YcgR